MIPGSRMMASAVRASPGTGMSGDSRIDAVTAEARFGVVLIAADDYGDPPGHLPSSTSADRLARLLCDGRGGVVIQRLVVTSAREVREALDRWAKHEGGARSSLIYLAGHGMTDGDDHW